jgi:hypothetical protein
MLSEGGDPAQGNKDLQVPRAYGGANVDLEEGGGGNAERSGRTTPGLELTSRVQRSLCGCGLGPYRYGDVPED